MSADNPDTRIVENLLEAEQEASDQDFALSIRQLEDKIRLHSAVVLELHREKKALVTQLADAQATIAALQDTIIQMGGQAAVLAKDAMAAKEQLAALQADNRTYINERHEHVKQIEQLQSQLTQRTAELEAANKHWDALWNAACEQKDTLQAELERVRGELAEKYKYHELFKQWQCWRDPDELVSEYEKYQAAIKENEILRALIAALPKVEGAVVVSNGYVKDSTRCHALFGADEDAALYAALLQHRQGMEG